MTDEEKKYAYLPSSKQHVVFLGPSERPHIEGFTSIADQKEKKSFFGNLFAYTKKNPFVLIGFGVCIYSLAQGLLATRRKDKVKIKRYMAMRAGSGVFIITAMCLGNLFHEGYLFPKSKFEEDSDMQKRLANVYFMAKKRKMEAESAMEAQDEEKKAQDEKKTTS